jgi:hypothetical protein
LRNKQRREHQHQTTIFSTNDFAIPDLLQKQKSSDFCPEPSQRFSGIKRAFVPPSHFHLESTMARPSFFNDARLDSTLASLHQRALEEDEAVNKFFAASPIDRSKWAQSAHDFFADKFVALEEDKCQVRGSADCDWYIRYSLTLLFRSSSIFSLGV